MSTPRYAYITICLLLLFYARAQAQEDTSEKNLVEKAKRSVKISGAIRANAIGYHVTGIPSRREPFFWMLAGNLNISFLDWSIPISATFNRQQQTFNAQLPFNQFGMSPRYKFLTLHLGYRSLNFSEYTLAGNIFLGAGVEVAPENSLVKVSAMYGRFARAVNERGAEGFSSSMPTYERWGYGSKVTVGNEKQEASFILFKASDNPRSLEAKLADSLGIKPQENLILGLQAQYKISPSVSLKGDYALSAYTTDTRNPEVVLSSYTYANNFGDLYVPRASSQFNGAFTGNITYNAQRAQLQLTYRRIGPEYRTMGSTFLNNDLEDITGGISWRMINGKVSLSTNAGLQHNNLNKQQLTTMTRVIGSVNATYSVNDQWNVSSSVANFNASSQLTPFTEVSLDPNQIDSLYYLQVTTNASVGTNYSFGDQEITHRLFLNSSYQEAHDSQENQSVFHNLNTGYQCGFVPAALTTSATINLNDNQNNEVNNRSIGPALSAAKYFLDRKFNSTLTATSLYSYRNKTRISNLYSYKMRLSYTPSKGHTISLDTAHIRRTALAEDSQSFQELRGSILYSYTF